MGWWSAKGLGGVRRMEARVQWGAQRYGGDTWAMQHFCPVPGRAAWRRIKSAMAMRQYPVLKDLLLSRELNITTLSSLSNHLTAENAISRIEMCRGKSEREIEKLVALFDAESGNSNTVSNYKGNEGNKVRKEKVKVIAVKNDAPSCKGENSKNLAYLLIPTLVEILRFLRALSEQSFLRVRMLMPPRMARMFHLEMKRVPANLSLSIALY